MDWITQFFTTTKLAIKAAILGIISIAIATLTLSVHGCIKKDYIITELKDTIVIQNNITKEHVDNIEKAIEQHKIIAKETAKVEKEMLNFKSSPELSNKINCIYENFNNLEYDC
jgi:hypothetical protein